MSQSTINNRDRQEDEVLVLSNIYTYDEFSYSKEEDTIECYYNVFLTVDNLLELDDFIYRDFDIGSSSSPSSERLIKYLPPVRIHLQLPVDYPAKSSPHFSINSSWLSPWQMSMVCQKLDEIWLENRGQEILFLWFEFLRNDLIQFLKIKDQLDVSFMHMVYHNVSDYFKLRSMFENDLRVVYDRILTTPAKFLTNYDKYQQTVYFENHLHECTICYGEYYGLDCVKLEECNHIYCKRCMEQYVRTKINANYVKDIVCPDSDCSYSLMYYEIKELCLELFPLYERLLLQVTLRTMKDVIFCPRNSCQNPLIKDTDDPLSICNKCTYAFCTYCNKGYHGSEPCAMTSTAVVELIKEYTRSNRHQRKLLERKHGRKQIQIVVEKYLTKEYLKVCAKPCPNCSTMIMKSEGCNKMTCIYCKAHFCWLCGVHITLKNAYEHFLTGDSKCYRLLFDEGEDF